MYIVFKNSGRKSVHRLDMLHGFDIDFACPLIEYQYGRLFNAVQWLVIQLNEYSLSLKCEIVVGWLAVIAC